MSTRARPRRSCLRHHVPRRQLVHKAPALGVDQQAAHAAQLLGRQELGGRRWWGWAGERVRAMKQTRLAPDYLFCTCEHYHGWHNDHLYSSPPPPRTTSLTPTRPLPTAPTLVPLPGSAGSTKPVGCTCTWSRCSSAAPAASASARPSPCAQGPLVVGSRAACRAGQGRVGRQVGAAAAGTPGGLGPDGGVHAVYTQTTA